MKHSCMGKLHYLLCALLMVALTGCGANKLGLAGNSSTDSGAVSAKLVWNQSKTAAKSVAATTIPGGLTSVRVTVTGTGLDGKPIPVVRGSIATNSTSGSVGGIYPGKVTLVVQAFTGTTVSYEGFAIGVKVDPNSTTTLADPIVMAPPVEKAQDKTCVGCHETTLDNSGQNLVANFKQSHHYENQGAVPTAFAGLTGAGCAGCHGPAHNDPNPAASGGCATCHAGNPTPNHATYTGGDPKTCGTCHISHNFRLASAGCVGCHSIPQNAGAAYVNDNNGVRSITNEFGKWSHHVTGVTLNDAHCAACHLEGKVVNGVISVDPTVHMADNKTHLRNADTDADMLWDPANPSFTTMDNFCLSCHDANGATSAGSVAIQTLINNKGIAAVGKVAAPQNPFGDTISNQYDKLERPAVVDAAGQFATSNPSHHAVLGKRYTGRTRVSGTRQIADTAAFTSNSSAALPGVRTTIYDAGKFQNDYTTLADATGETGARNGGTDLGDDSTLHCGDCHTVGQYRAADVGTRYNKAVIGAHGSNNEYLLRNNIGTDERHQGVETGTASAGVPSLGYGTKPYLVCYNCHAFATYGSVGASTGISGLNHIGEYANGTRCNGPYNTVFGNLTGEARLRSIVTQTSNTSYGKQSGTTTYGNVFGIQCANCHNSGISAGNIFGGIHGSKVQTYTDGMGNTVKHERFLPGLGNIMYVPGTKGGFSGGSLATFAAYSGNRNGTGTGNATGQTFTQLPTRGIVAGSNVSTVTVVDGKTVPTTNAYGYTNTASTKTGSYQYVTGGVSLDLNWEQKSVQPIAGQYDFGAQAMGCYTIGPKDEPAASRNSPADSNAGTADLTRMAAANDIQAPVNGPNGTKEIFDNWGGCDDHAAPQAGADHRQFRKVLRKVTY